VAFKFPPLPKDHQWPVVASAWCRSFSHYWDDDRGVVDIREEWIGIGAGVQNDRNIWGVMRTPEELGYISHWSYGMDYAPPVKIIAERRDEMIERGSRFGRFYFNAGASGDRAVYVELADLAASFTEMGFDIP
jgi:hypothetical protein